MKEGHTFEYFAFKDKDTVEEILQNNRFVRLNSVSKKAAFVLDSVAPYRIIMGPITESSNLYS